MRKTKVVLDFMEFSIADLIEFARNTVDKMTAHPEMVNPDVPLTEITMAIQALENAKVAAEGGGKAQTQLMHQVGNDLSGKVKKNAAFVERKADGDAAKILSTGYHTSKQPAPALRPDFTVEQGEHEGEINLKHKAISKGRAWIWQYSLDPIGEGKWMWAGVSLHANFVIKGLTPGAKYWFRAASVTTAGQGSWCDPVAKIAQ